MANIIQTLRNVDATSIESIRALAAEVAALLGAHYEPDTEDTWRAWIATPDGLKLIFSTWGKKTGEVWAYTYRDGKSRDARKCGEIGVSFARGAAAVAREIENRLLPAARKVAAKAREEWAVLDWHGSHLEALAAELSAIPGCRARVENPNTDRQRVELHWHVSERGMLRADITPGGRVSVERASLWAPDAIAQLRDVLGAMAGKA